MGVLDLRKREAWKQKQRQKKKASD